MVTKVSVFKDEVHETDQKEEVEGMVASKLLNLSGNSSFVE